ncbi:hypothetical protein AURDEDRAFT_180476 [Auricularia subglabra TFB-10046 SS5]|nr:hypothetical protein AURDEDRAFT_180476 [Auricularia subglabra TFB-10046 SS5]
MSGTNTPHLAPGDRFFNDSVNSPYIFPADAQERRRLNGQYEAVKCSADGQHIMAPVQLGPGDEVLDCATGTGVWLLDVAPAYPVTVSFHGIDISSHLFPPPASMPSNMSFSQHSLLDPPTSFSSSFTLINQRMLLSALRATEWPAALRAHFGMLRPGGWTQLCEINFLGFSSRPDGARTARVHAMVDALHRARGLDGGCALRLAGWAQDAGFVNIGTLCTPVPVGARAGEGPHNYTTPLFETLISMKGLMRQSGIVATEEEYEHAVHEMENELGELDDAYYPFHWFSTLMARTSSPQAAPGHRFFNDPVNSPYILPADTEEGRRLNEQHEVIKRSAGGKLVVAPVRLDAGDRVLDCATGTGVWLLDLANVTQATVLFHGIDISPHLFPPPAAKPANASFSQTSILNPPPSFAGAFTLLNQRLLIGAFRSAEWPDVLRAHFAMLRPGGWTQLCEIHPDGFSPAGGPCTTRVQAMHDELMLARGLDNDCALRVADWAREAGFVNVGTMCTRAPVGARAGEGPHNYTRPVLGFYLALKGLMRQDGIVATEEEYEEAVRDMENEWNEMDDAYFPFYWIWAQKPDETA